MNHIWQVIEGAFALLGAASVLCMLLLAAMARGEMRRAESDGDVSEMRVCGRADVDKQKRQSCGQVQGMRKAGAHWQK